MSEHNGSKKGSTKTPTRTVARSVAELAHDAVVLAELQAALCKTEASQWLRSLLLPIGLLVAALGIVLGCIPVLLQSLSSWLAESAGLSQGLASLIAASVGGAAALTAAVTGWMLLRRNGEVLSKSRLEFSRNVSWIRHVLKHRSNPDRSSWEIRQR